MTHGSLFSGIGGFDLAAEWMGWENKFHCEWNEFGQKVLNYYWPDAECFGDITKSDFKKYANEIDVLTGGWPCQKYSIAGSRIGEEPLKDEFVRVIRVVQAPWVVLENVGNFIGEQFAEEHDELCLQLEDLGYETQTFDIDAASCGLPTVERHIWIVATSDSLRQKRGIKEKVSYIRALQRKFQGSNKREGHRWQLPESRVCELGKGLPYSLDGITISKWHGETIQAIGNAIPPQVAYEIFKAIQQYEDLNK
jgi:DNA (cytosine-5)-methyltransferase 1